MQYLTPYHVAPNRLVSQQLTHHMESCGVLGLMPIQIMTLKKNHIIMTHNTSYKVVCMYYMFPCMHRSGKSSISKVVFHKLSPNETLFLESTSKVAKDDINNSSFVQFQVPNRFVSLCTHN